MSTQQTERTRRGATGVAVLLVLVVLMLAMIGIVISGVRDVDTAIQRLDSVHAFYAAEGVANMAIREVVGSSDESGDGTVGSIAGGVVSSGPNLSGARAAAGVSVSGTTYTVTVKGTENLSSRAVQVVINAGTSAVNPVATYAPYASPAVPAVREYAAGIWGSAANVGTLSGSVCWERLRTRPVGTATPVRALTALALDGSVWVSEYGAGVWGTPTSLTASAGTCNTPVYAAEYEGQTGNLMVAYRKASNTSIYYRTYTTATPSEQSFSMGLTSVPLWMEIAGKPGSNEMVLLASSGGSLRAAVWDGTSWGNTTTLESALPTSGRPFHIAYMTGSGSALVVWSATTGAPKYATWNGANWSLTASVPAIAGGVPAGWIKLAASPRHSSSEVLLACIGTNKQINVNSWNGASWGTNLVVETAAASATMPRVDVCYEPGGSEALAVWHSSGQNALRYRTWAAGAWSSQQTGPNMGSESQTIRLEPGYNSNEIMMLDRRAGPLGYGSYNVYSQNATVTTGNTVITGLSGGSVAGVVLPPPPTATANGNDISPSSGTVAPGTYGSLALTGTVTFTMGTYVFSSATVNGTLNLDTSAGPIKVIITTGGLSGVNNNAIINTGSGPAEIDIVNGDLDIKNNTGFTNVDIFVFNGTATLKNNANGTLNLWASGAVDLGNSGSISSNGLSMGVPSVASAVLWTGASPGSVVDLCTSVAPGGVWDPCSLGGSPVPGSPSIDSWTVISP